MLPLMAVLLVSTTADPLAGIRGLHIVRYDVQGTDWAAIGRSIAARGMGRAGGLEVAARTSWQVSWRANSLVSGKTCRIAGATLDYAITVTLPRLADQSRIDPALRRRWEIYLGELKTHEAGHARYAALHIDDVRRAVLASDCAHVRRNGQQAIDAINRWETRYDVLTRHGATQSKAPPIR
jgi:predicted secreted Zn-dependent protease